MRSLAAARAGDLSGRAGEAVPAGEFGAWLAGALASLRGAAGTEVPCGDCTGCCTSSYHVALRATDAAARARVPPASRRPASPGSDVLEWIGFDAAGRCPMLGGQGCSIYPLRPQTCRDYDCRVFAAAGLPAGDERREAINRRVAAWRFDYADEAARAAHAAVGAAARFLGGHVALFPKGFVPAGPTGLAVLALKVHAVFLAPGRAPRETADAVVAAARDFDGGASGAGAGGGLA